MTSAQTQPPAGPPGKHSLKGLLRHTSVYSLVPLGQRAASILLVPIYTVYLAPDRWGVIGLTSLLIIASQQVLGFNLLTGMTRFFFDNRDERDRAAVVTSATLALGVFSWLLIGVALLFREQLTPLLFTDQPPPGLTKGDLTEYLVLALLFVPFSLTTGCGFEYLKIQKRSSLFTGLQLGKLVVEISLKLWMLIALGWGVRGWLLSTLIGEALATLTLTGWMLITLRPRIVWRVLKPMVAFTLPMIPVGLAQLGLHSADRFMIKELIPGEQAYEAVGIYDLGYQVGYLVNAVLLGSFLQIWYAWIYDVDDEVQRAKLVARVSTYAVVTIATATVVVILFGRQAIQLLASRESYYPAFRVVPWVCTGYVFWALYNVSQMPLFIAKRTGPLAVINVGALVLNVLLNIFLVRRLGWVGASYATLGTFAVLAGMGIFAGRHHSHVPFEGRRLAVTLATVLGAALFATWIDGGLTSAQTWSLPYALGPKAIVLVTAWTVIWFAVLERDERARLIDWVAGVLRRRGD